MGELKMYKVTFRKSARAFASSWLRWHKNLREAMESAQEKVTDEYGEGAEVILVEQMPS